MKIQAFLLVFSISYSIDLIAQVEDSLAVVRAVDSLIEVSQALTSGGDFDKALEVNTMAEKLILESLGSQTAAYGTICFNRGRIADFRNDYPEAEKWYLEAKYVRGKIQGKQSHNYGLCLHNLGDLYRRMGKYEESERLLLEAGTILEKSLSTEHLDYSRNLIDLAALYNHLGNYQKVEPLLLKAKYIQEKIIGKDHAEYATVLGNLAGFYTDIGSYEKSELLFLETISIREKIFGKESLEYASTLLGLASLYYDMGKYDIAEPLLFEVIRIRRNKLGDKHPKYAFCLNVLANLYHDMGLYEKAEPLLLKTVTVMKQALGQENPMYASSLNSLAALYTDMGDYERAEILMQEVKYVWEKIAKKEHPGYLSALNNLAALYFLMNNYEKAESFFLNSKAILEKTLGKKHPDYIVNLRNLATLYMQAGNYGKAEPMLLEAVSSMEKTLEDENIDYAQALISLGALYGNMSNYEKSGRVYQKALSILKEKAGIEHPDYALCLNNMAKLYHEAGDYEKANKFYVESKYIREKILISGHPDYVENLSDLAILNWRIRNEETAYLFFKEADEQYRAIGIKALKHLSEIETNKFMHKFSTDYARMFSFTQTTVTKKCDAAQVSYDNTLFSKGFLLQAANQTKRLALSDSAAAEKYYLLKSCHRRLAAQYSLPIAERDSALVASLEEKANTLEKELVRTVAGFGDALRQVNWQEVQSQLKPGEAAVEFVDFNYYTPDPTDSTVYAALALRPGWDTPRWVTLFEQRQLDALLAAPNPENYLYSPAKPTMIIAENETPTLYDLLWAPLDSLLDGVKTVYYSPSGLLHRLNFDAIPTSTGLETLADRYALHRLNSTRELVFPKATTTGQQDVLIYGGIQYNMDSTAIRSALPVRDSATAYHSTGQSLSFVKRGTGDDSWYYLPGAYQEAAEVAKLLAGKGFRTTFINGYAASEESVKQIGRHGQPSPKIVHFATHGFFYPDPKDTLRHSAFTLGNDAPAFKISEHPMIRSGLILAGGNAAWTGQATPAGLEDGILTAYEISQMNLRNTELVVLSACETGLGDIQGNEGVYGLQRAFKIAGAKYLLMSLWKIPDEQTQELMIAFYREYTGGKPIPEAFRSAQGAMRKRYPDQPVLWAGFILVE